MRLQKEAQNSAKANKSNTDIRFRKISATKEGLLGQVLIRKKWLIGRWKRSIWERGSGTITKVKESKNIFYAHLKVNNFLKGTLYLCAYRLKNL